MMKEPSRKITRKLGLSLFILFLTLTSLMWFPSCKTDSATYPKKTEQTSDHFTGVHYFNPTIPEALLPPANQPPKRGLSWWIWNWMFRDDWPEQQEAKNFSPGPTPAVHVPVGRLSVTPVGHSTFLIQMDGLNILTDPIWSERCSPVSWAGPKRHIKPGLRFEDLPPIDVVLISHNHYDHLDLPTLERLAEKGAPRSIVPLGNLDLVRSAGITIVDELDWWQSVRLSPEITITLVPAQHFSSRTLWDRSRTLWGGFVISGLSGNVYYAGDTGYGPHFREIARRFSPIRVALLPISPFRPLQTKEGTPEYRSIVHMGPAEAVSAHLDLNPQISIAAHFRVFKLGLDGVDDAVNVLASTLKENNLKPEAFVTPVFGRAINISPVLKASPMPPAPFFLHKVSGNLKKE